MHLQDREFQKRRFTHYLRTGLRLAKPDNLDTKIVEDRGGRGLLRFFVRQKYGRPNDLLVDHYFFGNGRTFDLVARNLLSCVTRSRTFREAKTVLKEKIFHHLRGEARETCGTDQTPPTVKFTRRFSDRQPVDFTDDFFSLGNSYLAMAAAATVQADCLRKRINLKGHMTFEINDKFIDAKDIKDEIPGNQEYPGGTPFPIRARWSDSLNWNGRF